MRSQLVSHLTKHGIILVVLHGAILVLEMPHMNAAAVDDSKRCLLSNSGLGNPQACGDLHNFGFFKIMFEIISAYGTVGLSLGSESQPNSFCADWTPVSQLLLCCAMLLGRLRDLPQNIDHAFAMHWEHDCDFDGNLEDHHAPPIMI